MKIALTGSLGNIGSPLATSLVGKGHTVTVISSSPERQGAIEAIGAIPAIGRMQDVDFLTRTFSGADIVYLMETMEAVGDMFDPSVDFIESITQIGRNYRQAVGNAGVKRLVHLSSISGDMAEGNGILRFHYNVEQVLRQLPPDVSIKTMRPVGFFTNLLSLVGEIKRKGMIVSNYGGDLPQPWVSPLDIASVISEEMDLPFSGRTVRYIASDEASPNEVARALGAAIGQPDLPWKVIPDQQLLDQWLAIGFNPQVAAGFVEMQAAQGTGKLNEDYYRHRPVLGNVKLDSFAKDFAAAYHQQ